MTPSSSSNDREPDLASVDSILHLVNQLSDPALAKGGRTDLWLRIERYLKWRIAGLIADRHQALVSPDSVANVAYENFLKLHAAGKVHIEDRGGLYALLAKIAVRKVIDRVRRMEAKKRRPHGTDTALEDESESSVPSDGDFAAMLDELDAATDFERADDGQLGGGKRVVALESWNGEYRVSHPIDPNASDSQSGLPPLDRMMADFDPLYEKSFWRRSTRFQTTYAKSSNTPMSTNGTTKRSRHRWISRSNWCGIRFRTSVRHLMT
ncbi:MAG: ECF-type sigma factor [Planctomycetota bacterium]|nr:ECF-type sigma factor [Planctomycetota bacterium]